MTKRREFSAKTKAAVRERSGGICEMEGCNNPAAEIDHIEECWEHEDGGDNSLENAMHLCVECHKAKSSHSMGLKAWGNHFRPKILTISEKRESKRAKASGKHKSIGGGGWDKRFKKKMNGKVVAR